MSTLLEAQPQPPAAPTPRQELSGRLGRLIRDVRDRRKTWESRQLNNHAAWHGVRNERAQYDGVFTHYIPVVRRAIERYVIRGTQMLLPPGRQFEVSPGDEFDLMAGRSADAVRVYHSYILQERVKIRRVVNMLMRTLVLYQQAIVKTGVQVLNAPVEVGQVRGLAQEVWPTMRAVDPFNFYVWPETVTNMEDAQLVFEDVMMPFSEYERFVERGVADAITQRQLGKPEWPHHHTTRLANMGLTEPGAEGTYPLGSGEREARRDEQFVALTEVYFRSAGTWAQAWLVWNVMDGPRVVRLHQSRYPFPPYRMATQRPLPGELYTTGMMDDLEPLQILYNDQVNQTEEARAIVAVPPVGIDPGLVSRADSIQWGPRARWYGSKEGFWIPDIPDTSVNGLRAQNQTLSLINSIGGAGPMTEGQPTRGLPRAGYAVQSLISLSMGEIRDGAEIIEQDLLTPALGDLHRWTVAFVPYQQIIRIPGTQDYPQPAMLTVNDLIGNWHFRWIGTLQSQEREARGQRLVAAIQVLAKIEPLLHLQGFMINWPALIKMAWRDGLGERGVEQIVTPMSPQVQQQLMLQQLGQQGGGAEGGRGPAMTGSPEEAVEQMSRLLAGAGPMEG